jgi:hypothetical protein
MSGWKDDDEVTTTYGSIQLSLEQAHAAGIKTERERIIKLLLDQNIIRHCAATNKLVAFDTNGENVLYIKDLEQA